MAVKDNEKSTALTETGAAAAAAEREPVPLTVSLRYIQETKQSLANLQQLVRDVLVDGRDYGHVEGIPGKFLWEPGASQIIASFNSYPGHRRILSLVDDGNKISVILEVPVIHRGSQQEVGTGVAASSTQESKHKYRWVTRPEEWGVPADGVQLLKKRENKNSGKLEYRIPNPEHDELLNVIVKQASKRAEVDAAESLPSVASVLRELFGKGGGAADNETGPPYQKFWTAARAMLPQGADVRAEAHKLLGVKSMKEWTASGKTLDDGIRVMAAKLKQKPPMAPERRDPATVKEEELTGGTAVQQMMFDCFGWQPSRVWSEANYKNLRNFEEAGVETAWQLFQRLVPVAKDLEKSPQEE